MKKTHKRSKRRRTPAFKPLVIRTRAQAVMLEQWMDRHFADNGKNLIAGYKLITQPHTTRPAALDFWLMQRGSSICSAGRRAVLAARQCRSWKDYCRTHWYNRDARLWFAANQSVLFGSRVELRSPNNVLYSFDEFLRLNHRIRWAKWPFATQHVAKRKGAKR